MRKFEVLAATGSTNSDLLARPFADFAPTIGGENVAHNEQVLIAWEQTAGRGQRGRQWHSNNEQSLTFSLSLDIKAGQFVLDGFSLFTGLCVIEGIERWWKATLIPNGPEYLPRAPELKLKWPNDLVVDSAQGLLKIAGVLVETKVQGAQVRLVVGVGVNVFGDFNAATREPEETKALSPSSLIPVVPSLLNDVSSKKLREQLARDISDVFFSHWPVFAGRGFAAYQLAYQTQHALHDQPIQWLENGQWQTGVCTAIGKDGALEVLIQNSTVRSLYSSSVSVRRRE
jgi:BirA family transcriptional regulator, biotin operon repressor / biotin---[acetyl-CoA-carboxylase] ligase